MNIFVVDNIGEPQISVYHLFIYLILKMFYILGIIPFYVKRTERIRDRFDLYTVVRTIIISSIISVNSFCWLYNYFIQIKKPNTCFIYSIRGCLKLLTVIATVLAPLSFALQFAKFNEFYRKWTVFQVNYERIVKRKLLLEECTKLVPLVVAVISLFYATILFITYSAFEGKSSISDWQELLSNFYYLLFQNLFVAYWLYTSKAICSVAVQYKNSLHHEIKRNKGHVVTVEEYRLLWISLCDIAKDFASSVCVYLTVSLVFMIMYLILSTFREVILISSQIRNKEYFQLTVDLGDVMYMLFLMYVYCNSASQVTDECTSGMVEMITKMESNMLSDVAYECKINVFLFAVNEYNANVSLVGFFNINKSLLVTIMSVLVTYLVVIMQFKNDA